MSMYSEAATQFATRDRAATADVILDSACKHALYSIRTGHAEYALHQLQQAGERATRMLALQPSRPEPVVVVR